VLHMRKKLILASCLMSSGLACAYTDAGVYVGANLGLANTQNVFDINEAGLTKSNTGFAFGGLVGYRFDENVALELSYLSLAQYNSSAVHDGITLSSSANSSFLTANLKGMLPLANKFSLFGKVGLGYNLVTLSSSVSDNSDQNSSDGSVNFAALIGVGAAYNIINNLDIYVANDYYIVPEAKVSSINRFFSGFGYGNVNYLNIGLTYRF